MTTEKFLIRVEEAAEMCGIKRSKAYQLIQSGEWPTVKIGRSTRIVTKFIREWVDRKTREG